MHHVRAAAGSVEPPSAPLVLSEEFPYPLSGGLLGVRSLEPLRSLGVPGL